MTAFAMSKPAPLPRVALVHGPTPVVKRKGLDTLLGLDLWIKRDDASAGAAEAGNKARKLEFLLGEAVARGADTVITCGGLQSNHARATAIACASLGLSCLLFLRVANEDATGTEAAAPSKKLAPVGNVLLDRLVGAEIRLVDELDYAQRSAVMHAASVRLAGAGKRPYVIPEGGSNGLGSLGYVAAMAELREQMHLGLAGGASPFVEIVHACGSGGTAAGVALGVARSGVALGVRAVAVCNDAPYFQRAITRIVAEARAYDADLPDPAPVVVDESARGPGYAQMTLEQRSFVRDVARASGLLLDPVYTGKALFGLARAVDRGDVPRGSRVLFLHTGGLPGLLAEGDAFRETLE